MDFYFLYCIFRFGDRMKFSLALALFLASCSAFSQSDSCGEVSAKADASSSQFSPPANKIVVGQGRLYFYTAPKASCQSKDVFLIPGDILKVTAENTGWYAVSYTNSENGKTFTGWLRPDRLEPVVQQAKVTAKWCEEITLSGTVVKVTANHFNGSKFPVHILRLQQPIELLPPAKPCDDGRDKVTAKEVQLIGGDIPIEKYVNKLVSVTGTTFGEATGYHIRPVLLAVRNVRDISDF